MTDQPTRKRAEGPPRNLHDSFFKAVFGDPALAAEELRAVLPAELSARIEWTSLTPAPASFVDEVLRQRLGDLVFRADFVDGGEALLWFLLEHQSTEDWWMSERVVNIENKMWQRWHRLHAEASHLPAVVPVVVYHGQRPWRAPTAVQELYALTEETRAALGGHLLSCRFVLDDLCAAGDEALRARRMDAYARLCLFAMAHGAAESFLDRLVGEWRAELRVVMTERRDRAALFLLYTFHVQPRTNREKLRERLVAAVGQEAEEVIMTIAEQFIEEGREKGIEKGIEQGIEQGQRKLLLRLLTLRFGPVPAEILDRVAAAEVDHIERWAERVLDAASLDQVFAPAR